MSKLAKKPIIVTQGVEAKLSGSVFEFSGKEGKLNVKILPFISADFKDGQITLNLQQPTKQGRANLGTMASLLKNAIAGVSQGYAKSLEMEGIGFKASLDAGTLVLNVGFTHPVKFTPPASIKVIVEKGTIKISGSDKALVGETAAKIRKIYPPEPYKGKGIRYKGEVVRRKAGKKVAGAGASA